MHCKSTDTSSYISVENVQCIHVLRHVERMDDIYTLLEIERERANAAPELPRRYYSDPEPVPITSEFRWDLVSKPASSGYVTASRMFITNPLISVNKTEQGERGNWTPVSLLPKQKLLPKQSLGAVPTWHPHPWGWFEFCSLICFGRLWIRSGIMIETAGHVPWISSWSSCNIRWLAASPFCCCCCKAWSTSTRDTLCSMREGSECFLLRGGDADFKDESMNATWLGDLNK